ncbi:MAG: c-type cytochrome [Gemmataceae bacterium]|nr:c-type cytochrome [Gemmataceae bacterium]
MIRGCLVAGVLSGVLASWALADEPTPAERGKTALFTRAFTPGTWSPQAFDDAWRLWGQTLKERPANYDQAFMDYYGLHPAPYPNGRYPMGLRDARGLLVGKAVVLDCMACHANSILGQSYVGLGNSSLDIQALFDDMNKGSGGRGQTPFTFSHVRGTSEAGNFAIFLLSFRDPDLKLRVPPHDLGLKDHLCEDVPAWWHLKKKKTMYHTGSTPARSVRALMQFSLTPPNSLAFFEKEEATFRDIQAYLLSLSAPKYPFPIDHKLAARGEKVFSRTCSSCHGTYGEKWTYPSKIVPIDEIGTDRTRFEGFTAKAGEHYNNSWFAKEKRPDGKVGYPQEPTAGYQVPPLDGVWATAPYFHNGSVPTVYGVLNSKARPKIYTRSFRTGKEDYDPENLGWRVRVLERAPDASVSGYERRKVYDTTQPGRGNGGHPFGDDLTEEQRRAVIEYLKTL